VFINPHSKMSQSAATVLLVEDELIIRMNVADYLMDRGFVILEASNANEALCLLKSCLVQIDLVFTDVRMPGEMDGLALARWLREHRVGLPVILTSGDVGRENSAGQGFPADYFVPKPYELSTVAKTIAELTRPAAA
jgi:CheY-like chemotaxis protein